METRVYGIELTDEELFDQSIVSNEDWITRAERGGFVWTLKGFQHDYNIDDIPYNISIRII